MHFEVAVRAAETLRTLLAREGILIAPGAYDALTARLVEQAGFPAVYLTGAGVSYSTLAKPDLGLVCFAEMVERAACLAQAVCIPIIADGDTGYGGALNVIRAVREYERAGVAAIQLEDQALPKRCGHMARKALISAAEMCGKLEAACWARTDPATLIIGRTDARGVEGLGAALARATAYVKAGAEMIFVEAPESPEELRRIAAEVPVPCMANMVEGGKTPLCSAAELEVMGYRLVIYPNLLTRVMARAARDALVELRARGSSSGLLGGMLSFSELNAFLGLPELQTLADRFTPTEAEGA